MSAYPPKYRPDIDGLRCFSVLAVVLFHAFPSMLRGGFVGVDVFFVISGYLIAGILLREISEFRFSLISFYSRRFLRLIPALAVVLLSTWLASRFLLLSFDFALLGKHLIAAGTFLSNFQLWSESGYFDQSVHQKPLLHLWSLAIEEQFYLLFPFIALFCAKKNRVARAIILGTVVLLSFGWNLHASHTSPTSAFFLLPSRFWQLGCGCLLAWLQMDFQFHALEKRRSTAAIVAAVLFYVSFTLSERGYPGWKAVFPVLATGVFILCGPAGALNRWLAWWPFVYVGKISYPLYLWHWPMISMAYLMYPDGIPRSSLLIILALSLTLSVLVHEWVEKPVQAFFKRTNTFWISPFPILGGLLVLLVGLGFITSRGFAFTPSQKRESFLNGYRSYPHNWSCFLGQPEATEKDFSADCLGQVEKASVLLWGDSFAAHYADQMRRFFSERKMEAAALTASLCPPVLEFEVPDRKHCRSINRFIFAQIKEKKPAYVILGAKWIDSYDLELQSKLLTLTIQALKAAGVKQVFVIGQSPVWTYELPKVLSWRIRRGESVPDVIQDNLREDLFRAEPLVEQATRAGGGIFVPVVNSFCSQAGCRTAINYGDRSELVAFDWGHLTDSGARFLMESVVGPKILKNMSRRD